VEGKVADQGDRRKRTESADARIDDFGKKPKHEQVLACGSNSKMSYLSKGASNTMDVVLLGRMR